jgi:hypothetical protein
MIMSKQLILTGYSNESALRSVAPAVEKLVQTLAAPRRVRRRGAIEHAARKFSMEGSAAFGWRTDDIRRPKSV